MIRIILCWLMIAGTAFTAHADDTVLRTTRTSDAVHR